MSSPRGVRKLIRWTHLAWGVLGIPIAMLSFAMLVTIFLSAMGGGLHDVMYADTNGRGSFGGAWLLFARYAIAEVLLIVLLRRTRYPGPWYIRAAIVATTAELLWIPLLRTPHISRAFLLHGIGLALLLLVVAAVASLAMTSGTTWRRRDTWPTSPTLMLYRVAIVWAFRAVCISTILSITMFTTWEMICNTEPSGGDVIDLLLFVMLGRLVMNGMYIALAILPYSILLLLWLQLVRRYPSVEATTMRRFLATLVLALPVIVLIVYCLPLFPGPSWDQTVGLKLLPLFTLICWRAVWIPRRSRNIQLPGVHHYHNKILRLLSIPAIAFTSFIAVIVATLSLLTWISEPPSVTTLADRFPAAQTDLELILTMAEHDSNLVRIAPTWLGTKDFRNFSAGTPGASISLERWERYRQLFKRNHIADGITRDPSTGDTFIIVQAVGILNRGNANGYLHCGSGRGHAYIPCSSAQARGSHPHVTAGDEAYSFIRLAAGWYAYSEGPS
jgi:hypothetical protein